MDGTTPLSLSRVISILNENRGRIKKVFIVASQGASNSGKWRDDGFDKNGYLTNIYMQYYIN